MSIDENQIFNYMTTQSRNSSAKIAIIAHQLELRYMQSKRNNINWYKLPNYSLKVTQVGFSFSPNNFFYEIVDKVTQNLNSGGLISYILDTCGFFRHKFPPEKKLLSLKMEKLNFGFVIWIVCCGICVTTFMFEIVYWILKRKFEIFMSQIGISSHNVRPMQINYAKIYPAMVKNEI